MNHKIELIIQRQEYFNKLENLDRKALDHLIADIVEECAEVAESVLLHRLSPDKIPNLIRTELGYDYLCSDEKV